jgi:hypothetical protein
VLVHTKAFETSLLLIKAAWLGSFSCLGSNEFYLVNEFPRDLINV